MSSVTSGVLSLITFLPLAGALALLAVPNDRVKLARLIALITTGATGLLSAWLWIQFDPLATGFQFIEKVAWAPSLGLHYFLGVDGLSLPLVALTTFLSFIAVIVSLNIQERVKGYFFFFLLLETAMLGVFLALDLFLFYVFWELTLVAIYFLVGIWGGPQKEFAATKFFIFTFFGSIFMLIAILALYFSVSPHTFDYLELLKHNGDFARGLQTWVFLGLLLGFAVKIPLFPFHTWLPLAHVEAPTAVSMVLAGVLLKMGLYGLMRFSFTLLPVATHEWAVALAVLAGINVIYGALCSMAQTDMKRMIAYSSVNHMGYAVLGAVALNTIGASGAMLQMVSHGIITGGLFLLIGVLYDRAHTRDLNAFGGLAAPMPVYYGAMRVACFASLGLPPLAGFISEFLCFLGAFQVESLRWIAGISLIGILLTAVFFLALIRKTFLGPLNPQWQDLKDMNARELIGIVPLLALMIFLGVYPAFILSPISESLTHWVDVVKQVAP